MGLEFTWRSASYIGLLTGLLIDQSAFVDSLKSKCCVDTAPLVINYEKNKTLVGLLLLAIAYRKIANFLQKQLNSNKVEEIRYCFLLIFDLEWRQ